MAKKQIYTTIRYEGKRLEPGTYEFNKEFISAHPDIFEPETKTQEVEIKTTALEGQVSELQAELKDAKKQISEYEKEIDGLKAQIAASGGE